MADFDNLNPPKRITDPAEAEKPAGFHEYPRHVYNKDGDYREVKDEKDKAKHAKAGYTHLLPPKADDDGA